MADQSPHRHYVGLRKPGDVTAEAFDIGCADAARGKPIEQAASWEGWTCPFPGLEFMRWCVHSRVLRRPGLFAVTADLGAAGALDRRNSWFRRHQGAAVARGEAAGGNGRRSPRETAIRRGLLLRSGARIVISIRRVSPGACG